MSSGEPYRVLIVDDSARVREGLRDLLSALPRIHICGEAHTPATALKAIVATSPHAVILDADLHQGTGLEVLHHLRHGRKDLLIVILTIHPFSELGRHYLAAGADYYFEKGANFDHLLSLLERTSQHPGKPGNFQRANLESHP